MLHDDSSGSNKKYFIGKGFSGLRLRKYESESFYLLWEDEGILKQGEETLPCSLSWRKSQCRWRWELMSPRRQRELPAPALFARVQRETKLKNPRKAFVLKSSNNEICLCHRLEMRIVREMILIEGFFSVRVVFGVAKCQPNDKF